MTKVAYKTKKKIHTRKFDKCVKEVERKGTAVNPYAVCQKSLGEEKAILKSHRRK
jgi:hypothetical protein